MVHIPQQYTLQVFEKFGTLYIHNHDNKGKAWINYADIF